MRPVADGDTPCLINHILFWRFAIFLTNRASCVFAPPFTTASSLDHSGKKVPILSQEQGIGRGRQPMTWALNRFLRGVGGRWYSTYTAVPHYISSLSRSLFISTHTYMEFDFTTPGHVAVDAVSPLGQLSGQIVTGVQASGSRSRTTYGC